MINEFTTDEHNLYTEIEKNCKTAISKVALNNVRIACKKIFETRGVLSVANVAKFIANIDNYELLEHHNDKTPPKYQSILNNKEFGKLIALYQGELDKLITPPTSKAIKEVSHYPVNNLDSKTKLFIDLQKQQLQRLEKEVETLTSQVRSMQSQQPIDLLASFNTESITETGTLTVIPKKTSNDAMIESIFNVLKAMPTEHSDFFIVKTRGDNSALFFNSESQGKRLFDSAQWRFITKGESDG